MAQVITFEEFRPIARFDDIPWIDARIEEAATATGTYTVIDTITLDPVDVDPEHPALRNLTTELADDAYGLWYRIVFVDSSGDESLPTTPLQNVLVADALPYASVEELARILKLRTPSDEQTAAMERVLLAAAGEIDSEIDLASDAELSGWQLALAAEVNLERAVELWKSQESSFSLVGLGTEFGPTHIARNTWDKHAYSLAPLKDQWGLA